MHQITLFRDKKFKSSKSFSKRGSPGGEGTPLPTRHPASHTSPPRRLRRLDPRGYGAYTRHPLSKTWIRHCRVCVRAKGGHFEQLL